MSSGELFQKTPQRPKSKERVRVRSRSRAAARGTPVNGDARIYPKPKGRTQRKK